MASSFSCWLDQPQPTVKRRRAVLLLQQLPGASQIQACAQSLENGHGLPKAVHMGNGSPRALYSEPMKECLADFVAAV